MDILDHISNEMKRAGIKKRALARKIGVSDVKMGRFINRQGGMWPDDLIHILWLLRFRIIDPDGKEVLPVALKTEETPAK